VAVATEEPRGISTHNVLPCRLESVAEAGDHEVFLRLAVGPTTLLSRVARDTPGRLGLAPGMALWALVKSVALDRGPETRALDGRTAADEDGAAPRRAPAEADA
jgi:molybdate transport system ATP-binding protein